MSTKHIDNLRAQLPEVFEDRPLRAEMDKDLFLWPVEKVEDAEFWSMLEQALLEAENEETDRWAHSINQMPGPFAPTTDFNPYANLVGGVPTPGAPMQEFGSPYPPPDALAFYLPFHYFHPTWWGIYITIEGVSILTDILLNLTRGNWTRGELGKVSRIFLFSHEAFHHHTESFATRFEIMHRDAFYRKGFDDWFNRTRGSGKCIEEALATAYSYRRVQTLFKNAGKDRLRELLEALRMYIKGLDPDFRAALDYLDRKDFDAARCIFAEQNFLECLPDHPRRDPGLWSTFSHAFTGMIKINTRVCYTLSKTHPLASRLPANLRPFTYRNATKRLQTSGCKLVGSGKGSHMIWESPTGNRFPVPKHPGDLPPGTLRSIIKQAGLNLSLSEFQAR